VLDKDPAVCPAGGMLVNVGLDSDGSGSLSEDEIVASTALCHGDPALVSVSELTADPNVCPTGGTKLETGSDSNGNGLLDVTEITSTTNVCNGKNTLSRTEPVAADAAQCAFGGVRVASGVDTNGNGELEASEETSSEILCSGSGLAVRQTKVDPGAECAVGGTRIETGIDANGNGMLDDAEVTSDDVVCGVAAALFDTESIAEGDAECPHGGVRVLLGKDDGTPGGTAGDGVLQSEEVENKRNVCLAASDVLINGGESSCSTRPGKGAQNLVWAVFGAFALFVRRRRHGRVS
jgi:MYXO-CTERM domain-containing protein